MRARRSPVSRLVLVLVLAPALVVASCTTSAVVSPGPAPAPPVGTVPAAAAAIAPTAIADEPEPPLVTWPDVAPSAAAEAEAPPPIAPSPAPVEPAVTARIDGRAAAAEPLRAASDFAWDGGKLVARAPGTSSRGSRASGARGVSGRRVEVRGAAPSTRSADSSARGSMWGDSIGDSFGAGGLGLGGVGEGGGGKGEGIGLGSIGAIGRGSGTGTGMGRGSGVATGHGMGTGSGARVSGGAPPSPGGSRAPSSDAQARGVAAGEWDDNANFVDFRRWLAREAAPLPTHRVDLSSRRFLVVRDADGKPVPNCPITVQAARRSVTLLTSSTGRALLFPHAEGLVAARITATARCADAGQASASFDLAAPDAAVDLRVPGKRALGDRPTIDVTFVLDTTGSMSEEIDAVKRSVRKVAERLAGKRLAVRFALVEYKDRGDDPLVRVHHMTRDAAGFVDRIARVQAVGGGDMPEDVIEGLRAGLTQVAWSRRSAVRLAFLIGDAPPQLGYGAGSYVDAMRAANRAGIVLHTVAASGMDLTGQVVWRQIAQYTGGTNLFVLRGGAGPQSTGAGDARSSCGDTHANYTSGNLDVLVAEKVERAVAALEADPMQIAGLGQDERAKPCAQRVSQR